MSALVIGLRHFYHPLYCSPHCGVRLVAENDPAAYARHPYWKDLAADDSCTGSNLATYLTRQGLSSERMIMDAFVLIWTLLGMYFLLREGIKGCRQIMAGNLSLSSATSSAIVSSVFGVFSATMFLMHTHFNTDITHLGGGLVHHALPQHVGIDDKNKSVSEGYLIFGAFNRIVYSAALYLLVKRSPRLSQCFNPWVLVGLLQIQTYIAVRNVGQSHPIYHEMAKNGATPAMLSSLPYTREWRAFKHCITHHDTGLSFSGDFFLDPFWDAFLFAFSFLHNQVFKIQLGSWAHHAFSAAGDAAMSLMSVCLIAILLHVGTWFVVPASGKVKSRLD